LDGNTDGKENGEDEENIVDGTKDGK